MTFYDPDKSHLHLVATGGDCEVLGGLMRREPWCIHLARATVKYAVSDGAEWIAHQYGRQLPMLDGHILDYRHWRDHVIEASHVLRGEETPLTSGQACTTIYLFVLCTLSTGFAGGALSEGGGICYELAPMERG